MQTRILLADDSAMTRGLVRTFLESRPDFEVCGEACDGEEAESNLLGKPYDNLLEKL